MLHSYYSFIVQGVLSEFPCYSSFHRVPVTGCPFGESLLHVTGCSFRELLLQGVLSESCCYRASFVPRMADIVGRNAITMATNMTEKRENILDSEKVIQNL